MIAASVWIYCPGLRRIGLRIGTVQRADDAAGHGKAEAIRIPEGKHGLPGVKLGGVSPGNGREVGALDFDHGQVSQRIGTDDLCRQDAAIVQRHTNIGSSLHDVVVGDDVAIRRDDDAGADAVLDPRLLLALSERSLEHGAKELLHRIVVAAALILLFLHGLLWRHFRGDRYVDDGRRNAGSDGFHGVIKRQQGIDLVGLDWAAGGRSGRCRGGCGCGFHYFIRGERSSQGERQGRGRDAALGGGCPLLQVPLRHFSFLSGWN